MPGIPAVRIRSNVSLSAGPGPMPMQAVSVSLLTTILDTDNSLPPNIRQVLTDIRNGTFGTTENSEFEEDRFIDSKEVISRLVWSRSKFFKDRLLYPELTPVKTGHLARYSLVLVNQLITRLSAEAFQHGIRRSKEVRHVA